MIVNRNYFIAPRERQGLVSLTALDYIEEHELLAPAQLGDAKRSLQALFMRASSEETMLRQLIEALKATRQLHRAYASIASTLTGASKGIAAVEDKLRTLRSRLDGAPVTAEAHAEFLGYFFSYSQEFLAAAARFARTLERYLGCREQQARAEVVCRIAMDAREHLRHRLSGDLGRPTGETERRIRNEVVSNFDYSETISALDDAKRGVLTVERDVQRQLSAIRAAGQLAADPAERDDRFTTVARQVDLHARFAQALSRHVCLAPFADAVSELLKLYRHSHRMFHSDYAKLRQSLDAMLHDADVYFLAKEEDRDLTVKREKLGKIEALISFLEQAARLAADESMDTYPKFSRELSAVISARRAPWMSIAGDLLRAKVEAEAQVIARL